MEKLKFLSKMYLDKDKDIIINLYFSNKDEISLQILNKISSCTNFILFIVLIYK